MKCTLSVPMETMKNTSCSHGDDEMPPKCSLGDNEMHTECSHGDNEKHLKCSHGDDEMHTEYFHGDNEKHPNDSHEHRLTLLGQLQSLIIKIMEDLYCNKIQTASPLPKHKTVKKVEQSKSFLR